MREMERMRYLRIALIAIGSIFIVGVYPLMILWPAGWQWQPDQHEYEQMIVGIYATLGVFLILASRDPASHLSLIRFTIWSSVVHGGIMTAQALADTHERGHLLGDVPALFVIAAVLAALCPREEKSGRAV